MYNRTADLEEVQKITPFLDIYSKSVLIIQVKSFLMREK